MSQTVDSTTNDAGDRRHHRRNNIERLLDRAKYLDKTECALIDQVYRYGSTIPSIARVSGQSVSNLRRQMTRLLKRINSPLFASMIIHGELLPTKVRRTSTLVVIKGYSQRRAADVTGQTLHRIRKHMEILWALARV